MEKCENCGQYEECYIDNGMLLCNECLQRRNESQEYYLIPNRVNIRTQYE